MKLTTEVLNVWEQLRLYVHVYLQLCHWLILSATEIICSV